MISPAPDWLMAWARNRPRRSNAPGRRKTAGTNQVGRRGTQSLLPGPAGVRPIGSIPGGGASAKLEAAARPQLDTRELERLCSALRAIPADCGHDEWVAIGMSIHESGWGEVGLEIWDRWSHTAPQRYPSEGRTLLEYKWRTFGKNYNGPRRTVASIYDQAVALGWFYDGGAGKVNQGQNNGINGVPQALSAQIMANPIIFPDLDHRLRPKQTCNNALVAIQALGLECKYDTFHEKMFVGGQQLGEWAGELSDSITHLIRMMVRSAFNFDTGSQAAYDAAVQHCLAHAYDPVRDYLNGLKWDGRQRLRGWLHDYLGADDSALNSMIGGLVLTAAVRRVREPGYKFDQITVLEGLEGQGKSSAIETLAGPGNFSDQEILTLNDRAQQEQIQGVWLYEIADLAGMHRADIERVKAFASRTMDRARPAYARGRVDRARRCIFFATTNNQDYLMSQTGNRRFWPVACKWADVPGLARDRDLLWAEAAYVETQCRGLILPENLWGDARAMQQSRLEADVWEDMLVEVETSWIAYAGKDRNNVMTAYKNELGENELRVTGQDIFKHILNIPAERQTNSQFKRLAHAMRRLGWEGPKVFKKGEKTYRGFISPVTAVTKNV